MLLPAGPILLIALFINLSHVSFGQERTPSAMWLLPGVSWRPAKNVRLLVEPGYNHYLRMGLFYPQAFITVHKNIVLNPAYIYGIQKKGGIPAVQEHYLMNAVIFQANRRHWSIDDRNMLWNRLTVGTEARHYYRNRLRATRTFSIWQTTTRLYGYDEIFYLFNQHKLVRNRIAVGISKDITSHMNLDITYIRQWDLYAGNLHLFFIAGTWQL